MHMSNQHASLLTLSGRNQLMNMTNNLEKSFDVGAMKSFRLLDSRLQRSTRNSNGSFISDQVALRLYYSEMCIRITIGDHEQKIKFEDIYGVEAQTNDEE